MSPRAEKSREGVALDVLKRRAHGRVHSQMKAGLMVRPDNCTKCGQAPGMGRDGRALLQAHHHKGYDFPTDVQWLCVQCHRDETPVNPVRGESCNLAKLTAPQVIAIRASTERRRVLAARYSITRWAVDRIRRRADWKWLP